MKNQPIKILYIITNLEMCNGVTTYVMNYFKNMNKNKFAIDFLVCDNKEIDSEENAKLLNERKSKIFYIQQIGMKNFFKVIKEMDSFFAKNAKNYDIIHCHLLNNGAFFLHYAKKYGIQCRILHSHVTKSADTKLKKLRNDLLVPIAIRNATHYFACSEDAGRFIFKNKNFTVINNAIDGDKFLYNEEKRNEIRHEMGLDNQFVFGNIGRLCPQKNQLFLLDIFYYIKNKKQNSKLIMIGNGPWKEKIEEKIKKLDLESDVIMLDSMENIQDMYQVFDMFLFPSNYEGLGIVLIEAQTSGLRCFTSNMVPIEAKITDNFRTQDIKNHAEKWADSVLEYSEEPYVRASRKDELITHNYDIKSEVKKLEDIYTIFANEIKMK